MRPKRRYDSPLAQIAASGSGNVGYSHLLFRHERPKTVLDRFYAKNATLREHPKGICLLATCGDSETWAMDGLRAHYACFCQYMGWEDRGQVLAFGVSLRKDIEATDYPAQARALGAGL